VIQLVTISPIAVCSWRTLDLTAPPPAALGYPSLEGFDTTVTRIAEGASTLS
jgi:hypothetical protein